MKSPDSLSVEILQARVTELRDNVEILGWVAIVGWMLAIGQMVLGVIR